MDPITIGALAAAAGKAAYSVYKSATAKNPSGGGGISTGDSLARLRAMQQSDQTAPVAPTVAAPVPYQPTPVTAAPIAAPMPAPTAPVATVAPTMPDDPMARLRAMGGG